MANDPVLGVSVIAQAVAPSCSIRNFAADETGHLITVAASSAPSGSVTLSSSTTLFGAVLISTDTTVGLTTTATVSLTTTSVISFSSIPSVAFSTSSVIGLTTTSVIANTSFTVAGTVLVTQLTSPWQIQGTVGLSSGTVTFSSVPTVDLTTSEIIAISSVGNLPALSTASVVGLTTTSLVTLTSGTLSLGTVVDSSSNAKAVQLTSDSAAIPIAQSTLGAITTIGLTSVATAPQLVLNANAARKGFVIQNRAASAVAFLALASTAVTCSTATYSIQVAAGAQFQYTGPVMFTGGITGCSNLLAGSTISVTELT